MLNIINRLLSTDKEKQYKQYDNLKSILKMLEAREVVLKKKLKNEQNADHLKKLKMELAVIDTKRRKAINAITPLKKAMGGTLMKDTPHIA